MSTVLYCSLSFLVTNLKHEEKHGLAFSEILCLVCGYLNGNSATPQPVILTIFHSFLNLANLFFASNWLYLILKLSCLVFLEPVVTRTGTSCTA